MERDGKEAKEKEPGRALVLALLVGMLLVAGVFVWHRSSTGAAKHKSWEQLKFHKLVRHHSASTRKLITKDLDLGQLERSAFDPEAAVHEPGLDAGDLGFDADPANPQLYAPDDDKDDTENKLKARLAELFPIIDTDSNGFISETEMLHWHFENGKNTTRRRSAKEMAWVDKDGSGSVSLQEYLHDTLPDQFNGNETQAEIEGSHIWQDSQFEWLLSSKEVFAFADRDGDGLLDVAEYHDFQHPEESENVRLHAHMRAQDILERDTNKDQKLGFEEFFDGLWYSFRLWDDSDPANTEASDDMDKDNAMKKFAEVDTNGDGFIDAGELTPIFHIIHPSEREYAGIQAAHMVESADENHDTHLTLEEMINNPYVFYSVAQPHEEEAGLHDEF